MALVYKFKANVDATIDLSKALSAAGASCSGCAVLHELGVLPVLCREICGCQALRISAAEPYPIAVRLEHPMRVGAYSRQFDAEHDSINAADRPVSVSV